ncbi:hypothetical protein OSB04_030471 [Centaurea solstitialis]|uniref:B box-type domain-containing protein n=1 Tax=Centaurea solstitialis TaxID=347529 RepID=A0AA38SF77_9ASTR|nr:hypothetical protein OSB04_030471 [Centaurea solstitialis]
MKIQCNVCEAAEAVVLCCADEAALCLACDEKVHAANKLASKHQRVPLSNSNDQMPKCDICQETDGYFFCLEDRALLCRKCDVAIHSLNDLVSAHQRFLLTGVKIGVETADLAASSSSVKSLSPEKIPEAAESLCIPSSAPESAHSRYDKALPTQDVGSGDFGSPKLAFGGGSSIQQWQFDEFSNCLISIRTIIKSTMARQGYDMNFTRIYHSTLQQDEGFCEKFELTADSYKMGDYDCSSSILLALDVELDDEDCLSRVPDSSWAVPQISSPPTASGLCWSKHHHHHQINSSAAAFVPDVSYHSQQALKRRRHF